MPCTLFFVCLYEFFSSSRKALLNVTKTFLDSFQRQLSYSSQKYQSYYSVTHIGHAPFSSVFLVTLSPLFYNHENVSKTESTTGTYGLVYATATMVSLCFVPSIYCSLKLSQSESKGQSQPALVTSLFVEFIEHFSPEHPLNILDLKNSFT